MLFRSSPKPVRGALGASGGSTIHPRVAEAGLSLVDQIMVTMSPTARMVPATAAPRKVPMPRILIPLLHEASRPVYRATHNRKVARARPNTKTLTNRGGSQPHDSSLTKEKTVVGKNMIAPRATNTRYPLTDRNGPTGSASGNRRAFVLCGSKPRRLFRFAIQGPRGRHTVVPGYEEEEPCLRGDGVASPCWQLLSDFC